MDPLVIYAKVMAVPYLGSILSWIGFGLAAGVSAKIILPGKENLGWRRTLLVGILGAVLGGLVAHYLGLTVQLGWNWLGFLVSVGGALLLLLVNRLVTRS
jgi:uncharacterized membrane protein YeaQ/YmgE (transglycosylase-associated protein family)